MKKNDTNRTNETNKEATMTSKTSKTNKTNGKTNGKTSAFADILRRYENAVITNSSDHTALLTELATAVTRSVLKKIETASGNKRIHDMRIDLARDISNITSLQIVSAAACGEWDNSGDYISNEDDFTVYTHDYSLSDSTDLVHTAALAILEEDKRARESGTLLAGYLERPYTVRTIDRRVIITDSTSAQWIDKEVTPIQQIYRTVRREIEHNRNMEVGNKYTYIDETIKDEDSDTEETVYNRLPKFSRLASCVFDINGKQTAITADEQTLDEAAEFVNSLNLSTAQKAILRYRMGGYGYRAIASALGITNNTVKRQCDRIAAKWIALYGRPAVIK